MQHSTARGWAQLRDHLKQSLTVLAIVFPVAALGFTAGSGALSGLPSWASVEQDLFLGTIAAAPPSVLLAAACRHRDRVAVDSRIGTHVVRFGALFGVITLGATLGIYSTWGGITGDFDLFWALLSLLAGAKGAVLPALLLTAVWTLEANR